MEPQQDPSFWERVQQFLLTGGGPGAPADASLAGKVPSAMGGAASAVGRSMTAPLRGEPAASPFGGEAAGAVPPADRGYPATPLDAQMQSQIMGGIGATPASPWSMMGDATAPSPAPMAESQPVPTGAQARAPITAGHAKLIAGAPPAPPQNGLGESHFDAFAQASQKALEDQKAGIDALQKHHDQIAANPYQQDLGPLLALADSWSGGQTHLAAAYHNESPEDRQKTLLAMEEKIQGAKAGQSKDELALLGQHVQDQDRRDIASERSQYRKDANARADKEFDLKRQDLTQRQDETRMFKNRAFMNDAQKGYQSDKTVTEANQREAELETARREVNDALTKPGHAIAAQEAMTKLFANRITREEMKGFTGGQDLQDRFKQLVSTAGKGTLTPENHKALMEIIGNVQAGIDTTREKRLKEHAAGYAESTGVPLDEAMKHVDPSYQGRVSAAAPQGDPGLEAEMKKRGLL